METIQLTEADRKTLTHAAAFGLRTSAETGMTAEAADAIDQALTEAREHLATTSDDCAYIVIRVETV